MLVRALQKRSLRRRRAVSAILAGILVFAAMLTVGLAFFVQVSTNEGNQAKAIASSQTAVQAASQERLSLVVSKDAASNLALLVTNLGSTPSTIVAVFVTSPGGQLISTGPSSPYLVGNPSLNVTLPLAISVGSSTHAIAIMPAGCPSCSGTFIVSVLTAAGNEFSAQYPPVLTTTTSTSTSTVGGGSTTVTSTSTVNTFTSTTIATSTSTDCFDCTTTIGLGEGAPALQITSIAACAAESGWSACEGTGELGYVLYGGPILLTVKVQNLAPSQATNVQLVVAPTNGIPSGTNVYAQAPGSGQPSSCTAPQSITTTATFVCEYNGYFVGTGGTVTFAAYATGTIAGNQITTAEATSNPVQIGAFTSIGPWAPDVLHFYFTSEQSTSQSPADYITVDNQYVAFYISVTNTYSQPLTVLGYSFLMDVRAGTDPTWFLVDGMKTSGTPSISATYPTTCASASPPSGCITVASNAETQLIFASTGYGGSTMIWDNQFPESLNPLPDGESVLIDIFYYYNGQVYSQSLPFQSTIFDKASPTVSTTLSHSTIDANQGVTDTATISGDSAYAPTGQVTFTVYSDAVCTHQVFSSTNTVSGSAATSSTYTPSSAGTYYFKASYLGDGANNGYTTPCGTSGEILTVNPALTAPVISVSPTSVHTGHSSTLSTTTSFGGGTLAYTCQWLQEAPGAGSFSNLGSSFSCNKGDLPSTSTGTLTTAGSWQFELSVTDSTGASVTSGAKTVTVVAVSKVQEVAGASSTAKAFTCAFPSSVTSGDLLLVSFSYYKATLPSVSTVADTRGSTFNPVIAGGVTTTSTAKTVSYIYAASAKSTGSDTITVTLSSAPTEAFVTCSEWSGVASVTPVAQQTGKATDTTSPLSPSVTSFTPNAGDFVYAYVGFTSCSSTGTATYTSGYSAGTGIGTDVSTGISCGSSHNLKLNEADEYVLNWGGGATTSALSITMGSNPTSGNSGWAEIAVEFDPPAPTSPAPSLPKQTSTIADQTSQLGAGSLGMAGLVALGARLPPVSKSASENTHSKGVGGRGSSGNPHSQVSSQAVRDAHQLVAGP